MNKISTKKSKKTKCDLSRALQILQNSRKFLKIYNEDKTEVYHLAIIDYFTKWNLRKIAAQNLKGISNDKVCFHSSNFFPEWFVHHRPKKLRKKVFFLNLKIKIYGFYFKSFSIKFFYILKNR
jgi:hypothetical protein